MMCLYLEQSYRIRKFSICHVNLYKLCKPAFHPCLHWNCNDYVLCTNLYMCLACLLFENNIPYKCIQLYL